MREKVEFPFRKGRGGKILFFPFGSCMKGNIISSEVEYARVRRFAKTYRTLGMASIPVPLLMGWGLWQAVAWALVLLLIYTIWVTRITRGLEKSQEGLTLKESLRTRAKNTSWGGLIGLGFLCALLLVISVFMFLDEEADRNIAIAGMIIFDSLAVWVGYSLIIKPRDVPGQE